MNVKMAAKLADDDDILVKTVIANGDVASAPKDEPGADGAASPARC